PSIDINTGSVDWSGQKITGDILIDSANVNLTITDTLKATVSGGNYHLSLTGNSVLNANVGIVPHGLTYIWRLGNTAKLFLTAKDFQTSLMVSDSGYVEINNTKSSTGHCWLNVIGSGATIKTYNSYFYLDVADTTTGLHNIESTGGGNFYAYNSTFYFSGREGTYNTGGSTVAFGGTDTSIFRAYNCTFYDGGDRAAFYPQVFAFGDYSDFILENCTIKHNGGITDAVEGAIKVKATDALNVKGKLINCSISSNSGDGIWYYGNTIRPKTTDTLIVQNVSYYGIGRYFKTGRATDLDSTKIDFELLNKVNKTFNGGEMISKDVWFMNDVKIDSTLKVGTDYGIPSRYERSGGQIVGGSIKVDGLGRHDGSGSSIQTVDHVSLSEWCVLTGLSNGDSVTVTLNFHSGEQVANKNSFLSSDIVMFYYYNNDHGYTSQYDIKVRAWGGDAGEYYLGVTRNVNNGNVTAPTAASIVSSANTNTAFAFEVPILYGTAVVGLSLQAFNNLNVGSITMVKH
ncbi:MAG: hypothetical protein HXY50_06470, partial [Ignavibacteriaceae bacterium]|nr:hypothetical protein [Ignavibacteriaceae bacterium]